MIPACDCDMPGGAHLETCAYIRAVRKPDYQPDVTLPAELDRRHPRPQPEEDVLA